MQHGVFTCLAISENRGKIWKSNELGVMTLYST